MEDGWTIALPAPPSADGAFDRERVYVPLQSRQVIALQRATGATAWVRNVETTMPLVARDGAVYVAAPEAIHALDAASGADRWQIPSSSPHTAPFSVIGDFLISLREPLASLGFDGSAELVAYHIVDGAVAWRYPLGVPAHTRAVAGERNRLHVALVDGTLLGLSSTGELLWKRVLPGTLSEPSVGHDRVFVGSTDNFFYGLDADDGDVRWRFRSGGDVAGSVVHDDVVYFVSLDNVIRAVNRGNGNQRWKSELATRPVAPPRIVDGLVVVPGIAPALSAFVGATGAAAGTYAAPANSRLQGPALIDPVLEPFRAAIVAITRDGRAFGLRPTGMMFRDPPLAPLRELPGRPLPRERLP